MTIVYSTEDRIPVNIDGITFKISPLSYSQKSEIQALMEKCISLGEMRFARDAAVLSIKYSIKSVDGMTKSNGDKYQIELDNGNLTETCIDDLLNIEISTKLASVCTSLVNGIIGKVYDENGEELEGVSFEVGTEKKQ